MNKLYTITDQAWTDKKNTIPALLADSAKHSRFAWISNSLKKDNNGEVIFGDQYRLCFTDCEDGNDVGFMTFDSLKSLVAFSKDYDILKSLKRTKDWNFPHPRAVVKEGRRKLLIEVEPVQETCPTCGQSRDIY